MRTLKKKLRKSKNTYLSNKLLTDGENVAIILNKCNNFVTIHVTIRV